MAIMTHKFLIYKPVLILSVLYSKNFYIELTIIFFNQSKIFKILSPTPFFVTQKWLFILNLQKKYQSSPLTCHPLLRALLISEQHFYWAQIKTDQVIILHVRKGQFHQPMHVRRGQFHQPCPSSYLKKV